MVIYTSSALSVRGKVTAFIFKNIFHFKSILFLCFVTEEVCSLPPQTDLRCNAFVRTYVYHSAENKCKLFIYTGCGGNENRFPTKERCVDFCITKANKTQE